MNPAWRDSAPTAGGRQRDWAARAAAAGRPVDATRMLPVLPAAVTGVTAGNGHGHDHGNGHDHGPVGALGPGTHE